MPLIWARPGWFWWVFAAACSLCAEAPRLSPSRNSMWRISHPCPCRRQQRPRLSLSSRRRKKPPQAAAQTQHRPNRSAAIKPAFSRARQFLPLSRSRRQTDARTDSAQILAMSGGKKKVADATKQPEPLPPAGRRFKFEDGFSECAESKCRNPVRAPRRSTILPPRKRWGTPPAGLLTSAGRTSNPPAPPPVSRLRLAASAAGRCATRN